MKFFLCFASFLFAGPLASQGQSDSNARPDPVKFREEVMKNARLFNSGYGEQFCWEVNYSADYFVKGYEAYGDPEWLQQGQEYFDFAISKMQKDPDGFPGWIGPDIYDDKPNQKYHTDTVVGDAIISVAILGWAETVMQSPQLKERFGEKAQKYIDLASTVCWVKFNNRGQFYTDAAGWVSYPTYGKMVDLAEGKWADFSSQVISNNLNKHYDLARALIRLYRLTGNEDYKHRAIAVFGRAKTMFRYYKDGDRYVWNFWMPHAPYDMAGQAPKSWISVHPSRPGYQAGEAEMFLEAYDSGIVFTADDMQRMARTNVWMGHHGWVNADGSAKAGVVWGALARINPEVAQFYEADLAVESGDRGKIDRAYYEKITKKEGSKRLYREPTSGDLVDVTPQGGESLIMSQIIPNKLELANDDRVQLVMKTVKGGTATVEVMDKAGQISYGTIYSSTHGEKGQYDAPLWDGSTPGKGKLPPGQYSLRFTFDGDVRTEPVWLVEGVKHLSEGPGSLAKGETWTEDFEGILSPHWRTTVAEVSTDHSHGGKNSLRIERSAEFIFGEDRKNDLPVKVSFWVFDSGASGNKSGDGPLWGVQTTLGDKFVFRQVWRPYLDGNKRYAWLNTAENQFLSPHPSTMRKPGWRNWIFDFTGDSAKISLDGEFITNIDPKWTPKGCVSIFLQNGGMAGPLYVDDVRVEYPR